MKNEAVLIFYFNENQWCYKKQYLFLVVSKGMFFISSCNIAAQVNYFFYKLSKIDCVDVETSSL